MRTAYKVWSGIAAATFVLVASCDVGANGSRPSTTTPSSASAAAPVYMPAPVPARDPMLGMVSDDTAGVTKTVRRVKTVRDIEFTDGTAAHVNAELYADTPPNEGWERCADKLRLAVAHRLLDGKTVTAGRDSTITYSTPDWVRLRGYSFSGYTPSSETDYTTALSNETTQRVMDECYPKVEPAPSSSSDVDVDVHHDDHNMPDGALTGGYCRKKWWC